jgi:glycosyltransferase 2 family protein
MKKKRVIVTAVVLVILAGLVYLQIRTWRRFDWQRFWAATDQTNKAWLIGGIALIYADYFLRAWRWKILLEPVCQAKASRLIGPTMVGFTGLALFGRPGEFIRPFLISRKENLSMSSQLAVWTVERIFDMAGFGTIMALNVLWYADTLRRLPGFAGGTRKSLLGFHVTTFGLFQLSGLLLLLVVAVMAAVAFWIRKNPAKASAFFRGIFGAISPKAGEGAYHRVHAFGEGLNTVKDFKAFLKLTALSLLVWIVIGFAYVCVTHAYSIHRLSHMTLSSVLLLTAASVMGGILQLPVVGGGSQLATIGTLRGVFHISPEISTSCGIMLWLITFMSVVPAGLIIAHFERVSILRLERESQQEEEQVLKEG